MYKRHEVSLPTSIPPIPVEQVAPIVRLEGACADEVVLDMEFRRDLAELIEQALKTKR
jgi:hypothetical protein